MYLPKFRFAPRRRHKPSLEDLAWERRPWNGAAAYSDSKLHDVLLAFAVARHWPEVLSNALEPGWVPTKMGGARERPTI
jgi:NAD(P)-dependent dehydrogenase (short-subunit alcohol dehydrogenase family)